MNKRCLSSPQFVRYDGEASEPAPAPGRTFSQVEVDRIMTNHRRAMQQKIADLESQLSATNTELGKQKAYADELTDTHQRALSERESQLAAEWQTKLSERDGLHSAAQSELQSRFTETEAKLATLNQKYSQHLAKVALTDAAVQGRALNPQIVVKLLADRVTVDDERILVDIGADEPVSPSEAIEHMRSQDDFAMLFASHGGTRGYFRIVRIVTQWVEDFSTEVDPAQESTPAHDLALTYLSFHEMNTSQHMILSVFDALKTTGFCPVGQLNGPTTRLLKPGVPRCPQIRR